jgi:hypothetical protein
MVSQGIHRYAKRRRVPRHPARNDPYSGDPYR